MARRLVEDHDGRVLQQHAGDGEPLLLAARQPVAALADDGVVAVGQRGDDVVDLRGPARRVDLVDRWRRAGRSAGCASTESWKRCGSCATTPIGRAQRGLREVAHVVAVDADGARRSRRRAAGPGAERGLAARRTARRARRAGPARCWRVMPRSTKAPGVSGSGRPLVGSDSSEASDTSRRRRVAEPDVVELDAACAVDEVDGAGRVGDRVRRVEHLEHPLERDERAS